MDTISKAMKLYETYAEGRIFDWFESDFAADGGVIAFIAKRAGTIPGLSAAERAWLDERGLWAALDDRGIGGIADPSRIRCLHTWYAAHLVEANTIGRMLDAHWAAEPPGTA